MPEPVVTVGLGALAAYLGKDGLQKLLGPTAEYLGSGLRDLAQRRIENIGRIFQKAERKLGDKLNTPGEVPPRVLKAVLDEGSFCDDELAAEYFGGVLASSRTEQGRDDRGARIAKILDGLSTYQIRTHYLVYLTIRNLFATAGLSLNMEGRPKMQIFLPLIGYATAMEFSEAEMSQFTAILNHVFFGLSAEELIGPTWQYGPQASMLKIFPEATDAGIVCEPSALGAELFLWAFGNGAEHADFLFDSRFDPNVEGVAGRVADAAATRKPQAT